MVKKLLDESVPPCFRDGHLRRLSVIGGIYVCIYVCVCVGFFDEECVTGLDRI